MKRNLVVAFIMIGLLLLGLAWAGGSAASASSRYEVVLNPQLYTLPIDANDPLHRLAKLDAVPEGWRIFGNSERSMLFFNASLNRGLIVGLSKRVVTLEKRLTALEAKLAAADPNQPQKGPKP